MTQTLVALCFLSMYSPHVLHAYGVWSIAWLNICVLEPMCKTQGFCLVSKACLQDSALVWKVFNAPAHALQPRDGQDLFFPSFYLPPFWLTGVISARKDNKQIHKSLLFS